MDDGLNLARVKAGNKVGDVEDKDRVPKGKTSGVYATRSSGVAVRLTKMYYAVAKDGEVTADRVSRFCDQMSFERRSKNLHHGSLVTGYGSWGVPEQAPIKLKPLPSTLEEIRAMILQWPSGDLVKFITDGPVAIPELNGLAPGDVFPIAEVGEI